MVCKEEVFVWFKDLSGAKRIELMCGLMSMCIPLEIRFFESIIKELAKKDMNALREAELKANSFQEVDSICKTDLLGDIAVAEANDLKPNAANCESAGPQPIPPPVPQQPLHQSSQPNLQAMPIQDMTGVAANGTAVLNQNEMMALVPTPPPPAQQNNLSQLPARSKLIVSLCLLAPTNRTCSTVAFKALQQQVTAVHIQMTVSRGMAYRKSMYEMEDLFSGILLLLTMALHHPAFTYEQKDVLTKQKEEVEAAIENIRNVHYRAANPSVPANAHPYQAYAAQPQYQNVHHIHAHLGAHTGAHTPQAHPSTPAGVSAGGPATHSHTHSHPNLSAPVPSHPSAPQYQTHPYLPGMQVTVTNLSYTSPPLQNMSNLRISSMPSPVSTPSPANSPSSSKSTVTSVAAISPLPMGTEFVTHGIVPLSETAPNPGSYVLTGIPSLPHPTLNDEMSCAKTIVSCYNCGLIGHRGDECTNQAQEEANR